MEPNYVGPNGRIDAMAVAWLFAEDYVFFNPDEIVWDGDHHRITGMQLNLAKIDEIPVLTSNTQQFFQGIVDLLANLEADEELRVDRSKIHPALHDAIREGDLTALTLFNLQACARSFKIAESYESKKSALEMLGLDDVLNNPAAMENTYVVFVDNRLTRGIPDFYGLFKRMFEGMRAYNEITLPYVLIFANTRNFDANVCLDDFEGMVEGAVSEAFHVEIGQGAQAAEDGSEEPSDEAQLPDEDALEENLERTRIINTLMLLVLSRELAGGNPFPQDILEELDRAEAGDESVDLEDLARRMNELTPEATTLDFDNVTYGNNTVAQGRRFSMKAPDGWTVLSDYVETGIVEQVRPFVIAEGSIDAEADISSSNRIIYSSIVGDMDPGPKAECGIHDLNWAVRFNNAYDRSDEGIGMLKPQIVWDAEIDAVNTRCFVTQQLATDGGNGLEFNIWPYANDNADYLRVVLAYDEDATDLEKARAFALQLAASIELDKPLVPSCEETLAKALVGRVPTDDFISMVENFSKPYIALRQSVYDAAQYKHAVSGGSADEKELTIAGAKSIAEFCNRAIAHFDRMIDAYEVQSSMGAAPDNLGKILEALKSFSENAFPNAEIFEGQDRAVVRKANVFAPIDELKAVREKLSAAKAKTEAERKALEKAELERKRQEEEEKAQAAKRFFELDEKIKIAEKKKASLSKPVETDSEKEAAKISAEIADMESELGNLGFFARSRKKELQASIAEKRASLSAVKAKIPAERDAAESMRKSTLTEVSSEINALQTEMAPYKAIILESVVKELEGKKAGDSVFFGSYRQESSTAKATPIEWIVLETQGGCMLLLSKKVLACRKFKESKSGANTYAASDLCKWLTGAFAEEAFTAVDQQILVGDPYILGASDLKKYLRSERDRRCEPTGFAASQGAKPASYHKVAGSTFYWVGTPEGNENFYYVNPYGAVLGGGGYTIVDGTTLDNYGQNATYESGVRPAVRVRLK